MDSNRAGTVWAWLVIILCFVYPVLAASAASNIIKNILSSIGWAGDFDGFPLVSIFIMLPVLLIYYAYHNPQILYISPADQQRAVLTKMFWEQIGRVPDNELDSVEAELRNDFRNIRNGF